MQEPETELDAWRALFETFKTDDAKDRVPPPTAEELDRFESETGIKLPAGYRAYVRVFGPGCILVGGGSKVREMFIESPYCPKPSMDLRRAAERLRSLAEDPPRGMDEQTRRLVVFGRNGLGDEFGWDPLDVTDPDTPEFGVYAWYRGDTVLKISSTFRGFIKFTLNVEARHDHKYKDDYKIDDNESDFGPFDTKQRRVFQRTSQPQ